MHGKSWMSHFIPSHPTAQGSEYTYPLEFAVLQGQACLRTVLLLTPPKLHETKARNTHT